MTPNNVIRVPTNLNNFFAAWLEFLQPYHKLTPKDKQVLALFLKKRYILSKGIIDKGLLDKFLMSDEVKREVREELNISATHFQVIMGKLRRGGIIKEDKIHPKFIPKLGELKSFELLFLFDFDDESNNKESS